MSYALSLLTSALSETDSSPSPLPLYTTEWGEAYVGDALQLLRRLPDASIDLVLTSPPFALARPKAYGNVEEENYPDWFLPFAAEVYRVLKERGSFLVELGWAYQRGRPVRSLYNIKTVLRLCRELHFFLAQELYWHNPAKLPAPIEWVCKRRIRCKDTVSPLFWLAKTEYPKADWTDVRPPGRRSRHTRKSAAEGVPAVLLDYGEGALPGTWEPGEGVEVPTNVLRIANTESSSWYLHCCRELDITVHPARFPLPLPTFFLEGLTTPGDVVLDIFAGSNVTGAASERLGRRWVAFELNREYLAASAFRFLQRGDLGQAEAIFRRLCSMDTHALNLPSP